MNQSILHGKWKEIKGDLRSAWGRITEDEWEQTKGDMSAIAGLIQQRYGQEKSEIAEKLSGLYDKYLSEPTRRNLN